MCIFQDELELDDPKPKSKRKERMSKLFLLKKILSQQCEKVIKGEYRQPLTSYIGLEFVEKNRSGDLLLQSADTCIGITSERHLHYFQHLRRA